MHFVALDAEWQFSNRRFHCCKANCSGVMESRVKRTTLASVPNLEYKRPQLRRNHGKSVPSSYFSMEKFLVLICLTASMILLPLILPTLPPPPFFLLLLPVGMLVLLMVLAFMPSDMQNIASSYL